MIPLISAILYHGGELFNVFAFLLSIFTITILVAGYRQYLTLKNSISLEETFETIYEKSSDGIMLIKENRFHDCNEASVKIFGYSTKEELLTTHLSKFMPKYQPDGKRSVVKMLEMLKIALKNGSHSFEWLHQKKTGEPFWTEIVLTKITLNNEELFHGVWRDIEDRKKLEIAKDSANKEIEALNKNLVQRVNEEVEKNRKKDQQLLQQSRMAQMGEMISMIAHQWRQPLAAISATSASIELKASMDRLDNSTAQQKARDISNFSQHLSGTIDDFRNFFKPNKEKSKTCYNEIIKSVLTIIENSIRNQNIQIIQDLNCHESFTTYTNELRQVVLNLIKNAEDVLIEKKIEHAYIKISTYTENDMYILEVSDNGGGIHEELTEKIFDPYFSTKTKKDGTGLGLYMSKTIIEEHCGGELSVSNGYDGAVFKIQLPAKE
jgi:PAS domain S-box-containing protein